VNDESSEDADLDLRRGNAGDRRRIPRARCSCRGHPDHEYGTNTLAYTGTLLNGGQPDNGQHFIEINLWLVGALAAREARGIA
jgi:hypothetical protein